MTKNQAQVNATCLELLVNQVVPLAISTTKILNSKQDVETSLSSLSIEQLSKNIDNVKILDDDLLVSEDVAYRVESYGFSIGLRITEILIFNDEHNEMLKNLELLNIMKFICRDVWKLLFAKQMDNLRTNHRGTFVLIDNQYKIFNRFDSPIDQNDTIKKARPYLYLSAGLIKGVLKSFGVESSVVPEITKYPGVSFSIQTTVA